MVDFFVKYDSNKPQLSLVLAMANAIESVANVLAYGAHKYGLNNWQLASGDADYKRLLDACLRHITAITQGEQIDKESGLLHAAHAITNLMFYIELTNKGES